VSAGTWREVYGEWIETTHLRSPAREYTHTTTGERGVEPRATCAYCAMLVEGTRCESCGAPCRDTRRRR